MLKIIGVIIVVKKSKVMLCGRVVKARGVPGRDGRVCLILDRAVWGEFVREAVSNNNAGAKSEKGKGRLIGPEGVVRGFDVEVVC